MSGPGPESGEAVRRANVAEFNARGFTIVPGVFQPAEMESLAATVSELAAEEVANIVASGVLRDPDVLDWSSPEDYSSWQRANPEWQRTVVAMSKVQVMADTGEIVARKLNTPIAEFPACKAFRAVALSPKMLELASSLLGGRKAFVYSDQVFIKPPEIGGPKPWVRVLPLFPACFPAAPADADFAGSRPCGLVHSIRIIGTSSSHCIKKGSGATY